MEHANVFWIFGALPAFLPGLVLSRTLFPGETLMFRISSAMVLSLVILGTLALALSSMPFGLTSRSTWAGVAALDVVALLTVLLQRRRGARINVRQKPLMLATGAICLLFLAVLPLTTQRQRESYTEFALASGMSDSAPWLRLLPEQEPVPIEVSVVSHERGPENFKTVLSADGQEIGSIDFGTITPGQAVVRTVVVPPRVQPAQRYELTLSKGGAHGAYRTLYFWIRSSEQG